ncbi:carbohydrate-binding module family 13 protein, partial [Hydnum rufescens UP504]
LCIFAHRQYVIEYLISSNPNQQWTLEHIDDDSLHIKNGLGEYLSIDGQPTDGTRVIGSAKQQIYNIIADSGEPTHHRIFHPGTNYVALDHGSAALGTHVTFWTKGLSRKQT